MAPVVFAASAAPWAAVPAVFLAVPVLFLAAPVLFPAAEAAEAAGLPDADFPAAAFLAVVFPPAVFLAAALADAVPEEAAFVPAVFAEAARAFFFLPGSSAAALVDLPDADCCTAVFFATMAAAPSHIVILLANRAGTINRLPARGNGACPGFARHASPARRVCLRCAQLPAG
ncbi:hypothetical protein [Streptomyces sp. NPDC127066]|uniref:hypothetical protein n=1 Tax=Streptomyces sp. NPDC127066 TaxID=3347125 RepID=UPI00364AE42E